jgi:hypothetical protein
MMLQQMGHAITGGGFYNIEVEPLAGSGQVETFEAVIHFDVAPLSALQLADELKNLLDGAWDWSVAKVSEKEFSVRFPSRETLRMSTRRGKIYLPLSKMDVDIREAFVHPRPGKAMPPVWVQLTGLPGDLMERERLMAALTMIGRPLDVDELSVKKWKTEPVRVRFQCRFPERIKGTIALCVNGEPYTVGVQAELGTPGAGGSNPPRPPPPGDDDDVDDLDSEDRSTDGERWNRHRKNDKSKAAAPPAGPGNGTGGGGSQRTLTGGAGGGGSQQRALSGGAHSAPPLGRFAGQYGSNVDLLPSLVLGKAALDFGAAASTDVEMLGGEGGTAFGPEELPAASGETSSHVTDPVQYWLLDSPLKLAHAGLEGGLAASKALPILEGEGELGEEEMEAPPVVEDLRSAATAVAPMAQGKRTKTVATMAPTKTIKKKAPASAIRKSSRHGGAAAASAMEKAQKLAAERNLDPATAGTDPDDFSILDARSDQQIGAVLADSCILFVPSAGTPMEAISLLRAKEEAQAALARVAARQAKELAAREAQVDVDGVRAAAGEAAAPDAVDGPVQDGDRCPSTPIARSADCASEGSDAEAREAIRSGTRPARKRGRRSTLTMRKGRGKGKSGK